MTIHQDTQAIRAALERIASLKAGERGAVSLWLEAANMERVMRMVRALERNPDDEQVALLESALCLKAAVEQTRDA